MNFILVIGPHGKTLQWTTVGLARLNYPSFMQAHELSDFATLPQALVMRFMQDFDASTYEELWDKLRLNVTIHSPGEFYHDMVPARLPRRPARLTQHETYLLDSSAEKFVGPLQGRLIMLALCEAYKGQAFTDDMVAKVLETSAFLKNWKGKQIPHKVFAWYRPWFIEAGAMRVVPSINHPVRLNEMSSSEIRRLKPTKKKKAR